MKKILAILLAVMLLASLTVTAFASESETPDEETEEVVDSPAVSEDEEVPASVEAPAAAASSGARYTGPVQNVVTVSTNANDADIKAATEYSQTEEFQGTDAYKAAAEQAENDGYTSIKMDKIFKVNASNAPAGTLVEVTIKVPKDIVAVLHFNIQDGAVTGVESVPFEFSDLDENGKPVVDADGNVEITLKVIVGDVYGIVVGEPPVSEQTGESTPYALIIAAIVLAAGAVVFFYKSRKAHA